MIRSIKKPVLVVQSTVNSTQSVSLFSNNPNVSGTINAPRQYQWNITTLAIRQLTSLSLQVGMAGSSGVTTLTAQIQESTLDAIVTALNGLNVGRFFSQVNGPTVLILSNNKAFTYGNLVINQPPQIATWTTTGQVRFINAGITSFASIGTINVRTAQNLGSSSSSGVLFPPFNIPYINSGGSFPTMLNGDPLRFTITANAPGPYIFHLIITQNGITILDSTQTGGITANFNFFYLFDAVYNFTGTVN